MTKQASKTAAFRKALDEFNAAREFAELLSENGDGVTAEDQRAAYAYMQEKFSALESIRRAA